MTADFPFRNIFIPEKEGSIPCLVIATKYIELLASFHSNIFPDLFFFFKYGNINALMGPLGYTEVANMLVLI